MNFKRGYILEEDAEAIDRGTLEQIQRNGQFSGAQTQKFSG